MWTGYATEIFFIAASLMKRLSFTLQVNLNVKQGGKRLEHQGIRIEFVGQIGERPVMSDFIVSIVTTVVVLQIWRTWFKPKVTQSRITNSNSLTM